MPCTSPVQGIRGSEGVIKLPRFLKPLGLEGRRALGAEKYGSRFLELACGRCLDCKIRKSQDWATRLTHEASQHEDSCFLTLTFSEDGLGLRELQRGTHPFDLDIKDWQTFAKRLRKAAGPFRFFQVGEYGDDNLRPHYHALIFGRAFRGDGEKWNDDLGHPTWLSQTVANCWPYGFHEIKEATPESIAYVAKYVTKKLYGKRLQNSLERIDSATGECVTVRPELASMSRGGRTGKGIGHGWWEQFKNEVFPDDFVIIKGQKKPVPKYYTQKFKKEKAEEAEELAKKRHEKARRHEANNTPEKRAVRNKVTEGRLKLKRKQKL